MDDLLLLLVRDLRDRLVMALIVVAIATLFIVAT
jgi:hypothetical protein